MVALICYAGIASALGFGAIRVHSALNQPLDATINLVALTPAEKSALDVNMASADTFRRFGIEPTALTDRIRISTRDDADPSRVVLRLTTPKPVREPFLRFLIEADTGAGRALREYTLLLDPPGHAPALADAGGAVPSAASSRAGSPQPGTTSGAARRATQTVTASASSTNRYGPIAPGETLSRVARRVQRPGTTLDQMQVAIYRDNPQAFIDDMNMLLRGAMLAIPPAARVRAIDDGEARALVRAQRQQALARAGASRSAAADTPAATTGARLRLETPRADTAGRLARGGSVGTIGFGRLALPDFSATTQAVDPAGTPDSPASGQNGDQNMARTTGAADNGNAERVAGDPEQSASQGIGQGTEPGDDSAATAAQAKVATKDATTGAGLPADSNDADNTNSASIGLSAIGIAAAAPDGYQPLPAEAVEVTGAGSLDGLLRPRNLLLLAAVLFLIVLLIGWHRRRQYQPVALDFSSDADDDAVDAAAAHEAPVAHSASPEPDDGPAVTADRVPEFAPERCLQQADEQAGLGMFDAARDTLEQGLAQAPDSARLQNKRIELDYLAGDANAFAASVDRFDAQLAGDGVRWAGIASMGRVLMPDDPRFGGTPASAPVTDSQLPQDLLDSFDSSQTAPVDAPQSSAPPAQPQYFSLDDAPEDPRNDAGVAHADEPPRPDADAEIAFDLDTPTPTEVDQKPAEAHDAHDAHNAMRLDIDDSPSPDANPDAMTDTPPAAVTPVDTTEFDLDDDDDAPESQASGDSIEVRLDLARMYMDMDDTASARELLDEAINDGSVDQRAVARQLLSDL